MAKFIKKLVMFSCLVVLVGFLLQGILSFSIKRKSITGYDNLQLTADVNADLVLMGSSRCWCHLDPRFFEDTYHLRSVNIGVDGHPELSMTILRLKLYLRTNKPPKYAILSFDPFAECGSMDNNDNFIHKDDFSWCAFWPGRNVQPFVDYLKFNACEKYVPLYAILHTGEVDKLITMGNPCNYTQYGYEKHDERWDTVAVPVTPHMKIHYFKQAQVPAITTSLSELAQLCTQNNIKLLCLQTPVYKIIQDDSAYARTGVICRSLNIPFVDANAAYIRNNIGYFYNSNHMNTYGVLQLESIIKNDSTISLFLHGGDNMNNKQ